MEIDAWSEFHIVGYIFSCVELDLIVPMDDIVVLICMLLLILFGARRGLLVVGC